MRFAVWAAVSTTTQAEEDKDSLPEQERKCRQVGLGKGWIESAGPYVAPGASRTLYVNLRDAEEQIPALRQMLEDAKAGKFDVLMMWDYNRLRDLLDPVAKSLVNYGVQIFSTNQPIEPMQPDEFNPYASDSGSMMQGLNQIVSRWQIADLRRKYRFGIKARVDRGIPALKIPYGYMKPPGREGESKVVPVPHPTHSLIVVEIKNRFLEGMSIHSLSDYLTERYPTPTGIPAWSRSTITKILRNKFYAGKISFGERLTVHDSRIGKKTLVPNPTPYIQDGAHVPLYPYSEYLKIQSEMTRRANAPNMASYPWSGLLWCGECGNRLRRKFDDGKGRYSCLNCGLVVVHDKELRERVPPALQLALRTLDPGLPVTHVPTINASMQDLEHRRKKIQEAYESGVYDLSEAEKKIADIKAKMKALQDGEAQAAQLQADRDAFRITFEQAQVILDDFPEWMLSDDVKIVNSFLSRLFEKIKVRESGEVEPVLLVY